MLHNVFLFYKSYCDAALSGMLIWPLGWAVWSAFDRRLNGFFRMCFCEGFNWVERIDRKLNLLVLKFNDFFKKNS